jgi:hypothetical protein
MLGKVSLLYAMLERLSALRCFYSADVRLVGNAKTIGARFGVSERSFDAFTVQPLKLSMDPAETLYSMLINAGKDRFEHWVSELIVVLDPSRALLKPQSINYVVKAAKLCRLVTVVRGGSVQWRVTNGLVSANTAIVDADAIMAARTILTEPARGSTEPLVAALSMREIKFLPLPESELVRVTDQIWADVTVEYDKRIYS